MLQKNLIQSGWEIILGGSSRFLSWQQKQYSLLIFANTTSGRTSIMMINDRPHVFRVDVVILLMNQAYSYVSHECMMFQSSAPIHFLSEGFPRESLLISGLKGVLTSFIINSCTLMISSCTLFQLYFSWRQMLIVSLTTVFNDTMTGTCIYTI